jgi:hypothetical protein
LLGGKMTKPHDNYEKLLEQYHDLTLVLEEYERKHPKKNELINHLKNISSQFLEGTIPVEDYKNQYQNFLKAESVKNKKLIKACHYLCMDSYFQDLDQIILNKVIPGNPLNENLTQLRQVLALKLASEIESGLPLHHVEQRSKALKIATNTKELIEFIYSNKAINSEVIIQETENYAKSTLPLSKNWSSGSRAIISVIVGVVSAVVSCTLLGTLGFFSASFFPVLGNIMGAFTGILTGLAIANSLAKDVYKGDTFFKMSASQKQIESLVQRIQSQERQKENKSEHEKDLGGLQPKPPI